MVAKLRMHTALWAWMPLIVLAAVVAVWSSSAHGAADLCGDSYAPACNGDCPAGQICVVIAPDDRVSASEECTTTAPNAGSFNCGPECQCVEAGAGVTRSLLDVQR
jgi:hypothetical protein